MLNLLRLTKSLEQSPNRGSPAARARDQRQTPAPWRETGACELMGSKGNFRNEIDCQQQLQDRCRRLIRRRKERNGPAPYRWDIPRGGTEYSRC